jgi:imidazolonepropionase
LDRDTELKILRVANRLRDVSPINVVTTYLGAHVVPTDYSDRRGEYLDLVEELAVQIVAESIAEFFDVFCESGAFSLDETRRLIAKAHELGLGIKLHADQFTASGAVALGVEYAAVSIDHLEQLDETGLAALKQGSTVAVVMPGVAFHLGSDHYAPARQLIEEGVAVALATDFNPGSSFTPSMPMVIALACRALRLTPAEAIMAGTINAAHAIKRAQQTGSLEVGKQADIIICNIPDHRWLGYSFGWNPVETTVAGGRIV